MSRAALFALMLLFYCPVFAAENFCGTGKPHPIDIWVENAMERTEGVTVNIREVQSEAYKRWDKELNQVYGNLMRKIKADDQNRLKDAQRAWVQFRDSEFKLLWADALYGGLGGTMAPVAVSDAGRGIVRDRVCTLLKYEKLSEHP